MGIEQFGQTVEIATACCCAQNLYSLFTRRGALVEQDMDFQLRPGLEAIFVSKDQLRIAQHEMRALDRSLGGFAPARMLLMNSLEGLRISSLMAFEDHLGLLLQLFETGPRW